MGEIGSGADGMLTRHRDPFGGVRPQIEELRPSGIDFDDEELSRVERDYVFLYETSLGGPWKIDPFKTNLINEEFGRRGSPSFSKSRKVVF
jgi:hypothetical protein